MGLDIHLRGVMLLETAQVSGTRYLTRILIPLAETMEDRKKCWKHKDVAKARPHFSGLVLERGSPIKRWNVRLRDIGYVEISAGNQLLTVPGEVYDAMPSVASHVKDLVLQPSSYIEIVPRGAGKVSLGATCDPIFKFPELGTDKTLKSFHLTLSFSDAVPSHSLETDGLPQFESGDSVALYNFDFQDPDIADLDRVTSYPTCADVEDDEDFWWIYGLFAPVDGAQLDASTLPIPKPSCLAEQLETTTPRVSTCFPGFL